ncbi:MAG: hypothetical protein OEY34_05660 [Cyclobacteriaceae bacterium]|nr:hypothetical protein [Cyclobacteriaceae bacterium]
MKKYSLGISALLLFSMSCQNIVDPTPVGCMQNTLNVSVESTTPASGCNTLDGTINILATGGGGGYTYQLNQDNFQSSPTFSGLNAGFYTITVKDLNACQIVIEVSLPSTSGVTISSIIATDSGCGSSNGSITITASGTGQLQYKEGITGVYGISNTLSGLGAGLHTVFVKDNTGCEVSADVTVKTGLPFSDFKNIISQNCAVSGCHVSGTLRVDFTVDQNLVNYAGSIKTKTGNNSMPPGASKLTVSEKASIACWVDDGAIIN